MKLRLGGLLPGTYTCKFKSVEETTHPEYGDGLKWVFEVASGPQKGQFAMKTTSTTPTPRNACGKLLNGLAGRPVSLGEELDVNDFVGKPYTVVVETTQTGSTAIAAVVPLSGN